MMNEVNNSLPDSTLDDKARACFLALMDDNLSFAECKDWLAWLDADPCHQEAFDRVTQVWNALDRCEGIRSAVTGIKNAATSAMPPMYPCATIGPAPDATTAAGAAKFSLRFGRSVFFVGIMVIVTAIFGTQGYWEQLWPRPLILEARVAEKRAVSLRDGSQIILAGDSRVEVDYSRKKRDVTLVRGHVMFSVAKDAQRPFVVHAGHGEVTALGTQFDVNKMSNSVSVTVKEGIVKVVSAKAAGPNGAESQPGTPVFTLLGMGEKVSYSSVGVLGQVEQVDLERELAWERGRLVFIGQPLAQAIEEINRYSRIRIQFRAEDIAGLTVSGTINLGQIDEWLKGLESGYPLKTLPGGGDMILLVRSSVEHRGAMRRAAQSGANSQ